MSWSEQGRAFGLFAAGLLVHILIWRWRHPRRHLTALLGAFAIPPLAAILLWSRAPGTPIMLLYAALAATYIQIYPAAQASSPTLWILLIVASRPEGLSEAEIARRFDAARLVRERLDDLVDAGLAREDADSGLLSITARGAAFIKPFLALRSWLGLPVGAG